MTYLNTAPMITDVTLTPSLNEGGTATLAGRLVDPNPGDVLQLEVNWGDGSLPVTIVPGLDPFSLRHQYLNPATYPVHFIWSDNHGGSNQRTLSVLVRNVLPTLSSVNVTAIGLVATLNGVIADHGSLDNFTLVVKWDADTTKVYSLAAGTTSFAVTHKYNKPGTKEIRLNLQDNDGSSVLAKVNAKLHRFHFC